MTRSLKLGGKTGKARVAALRKCLVDKKRRNQLKELYDAFLWKDHNLVSMSLYSGPTFDADTIHCEWHHGRRWHRREQFIGTRYGGSSRPGWIGAGDAKLVSASRLKSFADHYRTRLSRTGTFVLPHHGSKHNFKGHLLRQELAPYIWCASAGQNSYGHPDPSLRRALGRRGEFVRVSHIDGFDLLEKVQWFR